MRNPKSLSRRDFLAGTAGMASALPFLPSILRGLVPREARAAGTARKRFLAIHNGHAQAVEQWLPDHSKFVFTEQGAHAREVALSAIPGSISPILGSAFDSLKPKLLLLSRLDPTSGQINHNAEAVLSGGVRGEFQNSLDQVLAAKLSGGAPLNLYVRSVFDPYYTGASHVSVSKGAYSPGQFNPSAVFASLFGGSGGASGPDARIPRRELAAVDRVVQEFQRLRAGTRISLEDSRRLDQHLELISGVQRKLAAGAAAAGEPVAACASPAGPRSSPVNSGVATDYQVVIDQMFDVLEVAIKCGRVQVATLMLHVYDYFNGSVAFIPGVSGSVRFHEDIGHSETAENRAMKLAVNRFFGDRVARFLKNLDTVEDPVTGATYLDNSLVLWGNDQGTFKTVGAHTSGNNPVLLAGKAGGYLRTGRYVDYGPALSVDRAVGADEWQYYKAGRPYNQLLITIAQAMGLQPADYETPGAEGFGVYGPRLSSHDYLPGNHRREILPLLKA